MFDGGRRSIRSARRSRPSVRMLLTTPRTSLPAAAFVARHGAVFAVFDGATQDSGNVSYGVRAGGERYFVKTAGDPDDPRPFLAHDGRVAVLRNAVRLARSTAHPALPRLRHVVEAPDGPLVVYDWVDGELIGAPRVRRDDPASAYARFRALGAPEAVAALDAVFGLHVELARRGWIACDFYDGSLIYDFAARRIHVVDLDHYRDAPYTNAMGRLFGSTRFMAPEEHALGATIDERTTVFTLGRTIQALLLTAAPAVAAVAARACAPEPGRRYATVAAFYAAWVGAAACGSACVDATRCRRRGACGMG